jgi:hypothetical protein
MALKLPRLPLSGQLIVDGKPTQMFQQFWDQFAKAIENSINDLSSVQATLIAQQAAITAAQADIVTQLGLITAAQAAADSAHLNDKISSSSTAPSVVLSALDAGASATINIAANTRLYGDGATLAVAGGSLTGLAYSTLYAVYYDDPTTADTTPTYIATTVLKDAGFNQAPGRHYVDQITTPAAAGAPTSGGGGRPPGGGGPYP